MGEAGMSRFWAGVVKSPPCLFAECLQKRGREKNFWSILTIHYILFKETCQAPLLRPLSAPLLLFFSRVLLSRRKIQKKALFHFESRQVEPRLRPLLNFEALQHAAAACAKSPPILGRRLFFRSQTYYAQCRTVEPLAIANTKLAHV